MKLTFIEAVQTLKTGNEQAAWEIAQQDDGLLTGITKEQWLTFAYGVIEMDKKRSTAEDYTEAFNR